MSYIIASIRTLTYLTYYRYDVFGDVLMETVKLSPKFQVVIPKKVRKDLQLAPGQELHIYVLDGTIRIHPPHSIKDLRGAAKGMNWKDRYRDHSDRF